jgi:hypothetical protein
MSSRNIMKPPKNMCITNGSQMMVCISNKIEGAGGVRHFNLKPGKTYECFVHDGNVGFDIFIPYVAENCWWVKSGENDLYMSSWGEYEKKLFISIDEWRHMQLDKVIEN